MIRASIWIIAVSALIAFVFLVALSVHNYMFPPTPSESRVASEKEKRRVIYHGIRDLTPAPECEGQKCYFVRDGKRIRL